MQDRDIEDIYTIAKRMKQVNPIKKASSRQYLRYHLIDGWTIPPRVYE